MNYSLLIARILIVIIVFIILLSYLISNFTIDVTKYVIESKKIPKIFNGYKIVQLSDLHNVSFGKNNKDLLKKLEDINPDIIVMTGDMVNTNSRNYDNFFNLAESVSEKYTCYYIMGNHEQRLVEKKQQEILAKLTELKINILNNSTLSIQNGSESINIYGLIQPLSTYKNVLKNNNDKNFTLSEMEKIFPDINKENFNILLAHSPFDFKTFSNWGADLVLSGHVHGGLIRFPIVGGLLSPERTFFPKYDAGEFSINDSKMIISRGLGNGTINLRVFNNPEICVIELVSN